MVTERQRQGDNQPGVGVDSHGGAVIDPTANVIALVTAGMQRQDDLREMEARHFRELLTQETKHAEDLRLAEAKRIDAIRSVDVAAVAQASQQASQVATTLASQVATSAETLRTQVQAAAQAATVALAAALEPIQKDIADLRRVQYEQQGQRAGAVDQRSDARNAGIDGRAMVAVGLSGLFFLVSIATLIISLAGR